MLCDWISRIFASKFLHQGQGIRPIFDQSKELRIERRPQLGRHLRKVLLTHASNLLVGILQNPRYRTIAIKSFIRQILVFRLILLSLNNRQARAVLPLSRFVFQVFRHAGRSLSHNLVQRHRRISRRIRTAHFRHLRAQRRDDPFGLCRSQIAP